MTDQDSIFQSWCWTFNFPSQCVTGRDMAFNWFLWLPLTAPQCHYFKLGVPGSIQGKVGQALITYLDEQMSLSNPRKRCKVFITCRSSTHCWLHYCGGGKSGFCLANGKKEQLMRVLLCLQPQSSAWALGKASGTLWCRECAERQVLCAQPAWGWFKEGDGKLKLKAFPTTGSETSMTESSWHKTGCGAQCQCTSTKTTELSFQDVDLNIHSPELPLWFSWGWKAANYGIGVTLL